MRRVKLELYPKKDEDLRIIGADPQVSSRTEKRHPRLPTPMILYSCVRGARNRRFSYCRLPQTAGYRLLIGHPRVAVRAPFSTKPLSRLQPSNKTTMLSQQQSIRLFPVWTWVQIAQLLALQMKLQSINSKVYFNLCRKGEDMVN